MNCLFKEGFLSLLNAVGPVLSQAAPRRLLPHTSDLLHSAGTACCHCSACNSAAQYSRNIPGTDWWHCYCCKWKWDQISASNDSGTNFFLKKKKAAYKMVLIFYTAEDYFFTTIIKVVMHWKSLFVVSKHFYCYSSISKFPRPFFWHFRHRSCSHLKGHKNGWAAIKVTQRGKETWMFYIFIEFIDIFRKIIKIFTRLHWKFKTFLWCFLHLNRAYHLSCFVIVIQWE